MDYFLTEEQTFIRDTARQIAEEKVIEFLLGKAKVKEISVKKAAEKKAAEEGA